MLVFSTLCFIAFGLNMIKINPSFILKIATNIDVFFLKKTHFYYPMFLFLNRKLMVVHRCVERARASFIVTGFVSS